MTNDPFQPSDFLSIWEQEDETPYAFYLEFRILNIALSRHMSTSPIVSVGPSDGYILRRIANHYPLASLDERLKKKHSIDHFIEEQKLPLQYMKVDAAIMPRDAP